MREPSAARGWTGDAGVAIERCRERLDRIDTALIAVVGERMRLCEEIAQHKRKGHIPVVQPSRMEHVRSKCVREGRLVGLHQAFIERLIDVITQESLRLEDVIVGE